MKDLPARIRLDAEPVKLAPGVFELNFSIEEYDVPEEGGEVRPFHAPEKK
jgi:hypothetical protein